MPYPAQVSRESILTQARAMAERDGLENLTLQKLAAALGIQAPSLYRHVASKNALLQALNDETTRRLVSVIREAAGGETDPARRVLRMAQTYRAFARANPVTYMLAFSNTGPELRPDPAQMQTIVLPVQAVIAAVTGESQSLSALGGFWALIHGYVMLELAGQFQRAPDLDRMFDEVIMAFLRGWDPP